MASTCFIEPLSLPIKNYTLSTQVVNRGVEFSINDQVLSFRPEVSTSNVHVFNSLICPNSNNTARCIGNHGGVYVVEESSEEIFPASLRWNGTYDPSLENDIGILLAYGIATFGNKSVPPLPGLPFVIKNKPNFDDQGGLALGPQSSFLDALVHAKLVAGRSIGLSFGSRSVERPQTGVLTLGGWEPSRVKGGDQLAFVTFPVANNTACPLQVTIQDVRVRDTRSGFETTLLSSTYQRYVACVEPHNNRFVFTSEMVERFKNLTTYDPSVGPGILYTPENAPTDLELVIELDNGFNSTIPTYEFTSLSRGTTDNGTYSIIEPRLYQAGMRKNQDSDDGPESQLILGGIFLSMNYLLIDYDRMEWGLAPSEVSGPSVTGPQKLCPPTVDPTPKNPYKLAAVVGLPILGITALVLAVLAGILYRRKYPVRPKTPPSPQITYSRAELEDNPKEAQTRVPYTPA